MAPETLENESGFDRRVAGGVCLICFCTPWSVPCRLQLSILEALGRYYGRRVLILEINVDYMENLRRRYGVHNIPTLIVLNNGVESHRLVGVHPESDLCRVIDSELAAAPSAENKTNKINTVKLT